MKEEWLFHGAVVPIDVETTAALVAEIKRLIDIVGGMALAQPEQDPVAWMTINEYGEEDDIHYENPEGHLMEGWTYKPLYTHPPTAQPEKEPMEYWNAVEGWVKIDEVREHFGSVGCGTIYKTAGEDRVPLYTTPPQRTKQEPVAFASHGVINWIADKQFQHEADLYTTPPQREFVGLTDEEIKAFDTWHDNREEEVGWCNPSEIVAYIEAKLRSKNNG